MPSVFETAPAAAAIPITFATKATWDAICAGLPGKARQFALANGFAAKPGACLTLPAADGTIAHVLFGLEDETGKSRDLFRPGLLPGLLPPGVYRFANAPHDTRLATLAFALGSYRFGRYRKADAPDVRLVPPDGIDVAAITRMAEAAHACPRPHQYAVERHGAGRTGAGGATSRPALRRAFQLHRRRRPDATEFSADSRGRDGVVARAAADRSDLGRSRPPQGDAGRQGRLLRYRRARPEAVRRHADHEEGHGRGRQRAGAGADGDGCEAQGAAARPDSRGRERGRRQRLPPARYLPLAQGHHGGNRQYRRRRPA